MCDERCADITEVALEDLHSYLECVYVCMNAVLKFTDSLYVLTQ
jgi:hypothetical protein